MARYLPLKPGTFRWGSPFGDRPGGMHYGQDFAANDGTPIYAAQAGTVVHIGAASGFGQWIVIDHPAEDGSGTTVYGHMWNALATGLKAGDRVQAGQHIGYVGNNGQSTGPHLHFEVHPTVWRQYSQIDPARWLANALSPGGTSSPKSPPAQEEPPVPALIGDPLWLADALRREGSKLVEYPGWRDRGHGDFKDIRGIMFHHTGSDNATARSIADGRPDLPGPLSQLHIARDGTVTLVAAGVAWHAGQGSYPWLPVNMGNWHLIGVEVAILPRPGAPHREHWTDAQYDAMIRVGCAFRRYTQLGEDRVIGHKEYAGRAQGKWDPGACDMDIVRSDVTGGLLASGGPVHPPIVIPDAPPPPPPVGAWAGVLIHRGMRGPQVAELQRRLKNAYSSYAGGLVVDGDFGPATEAAVREFQRRTPGLAVDGVVGPATAAALRLKVLETV